MIGQNSEKSPEDMMKLAVSQTHVKDDNLKVLRKTANHNNCKAKKPKQMNVVQSP